MTRKEKEQQVAWLRDNFSGAKALFLTDFCGLSVEEMNSLRSEMRKANVSFKVLKNTLARLASKDSEVAVVMDDLVGPRAAAWTSDVDDIPAMAKALADFAKDKPKLELISGMYAGKKISVDDLKKLAKLPSREELLAKLLGTMSAPATAFVGTLAAIPRSFLNVLKAVEDQKRAAS